jgi:outer membrane lipoprotein-sorting protein
MRHPILRYAAAAVFLVAICGVVLWFHSGGASPAFADFIKPILNARSVKFKTTMEHGSTITKADVMVLEPYRMREEQLDANGITLIAIQDSDTGKILLLFPAQKRAIVSYVANPKENIPQNFFTTFLAQLRDAQDDSCFERTPLGEKEIDGRRAIGFRLVGYAMVIDLWGDPQTRLPIRAEGRAQSWPNIGWIASDFEFNVDLDESLFSTEPPPGYSVEKMGDPPVLPKVEPRAGRKVEPPQ